MKKEYLGIFVGIAILVAFQIAAAGMMIPASKIAKENGGAAVEKSPAISGDWSLNAPGLEKIEFIHWKKGFAKPETAKAPKPPSCYKFLTPTKIKWTVLPADYQINPTNPQNLEFGFIFNAVFNSAEAWDAATTKELMNDNYAVDYGAAYGIQDYKNAVTFGDYPTAGVIAVTSVWYNPAAKTIVEFDIMFDTDWTWGDATIGSGESLMDLQNIATHEFGHAIGLGDVYDSACSAVTMYGYSDYGDTAKRTLEAPDIKGLQTLYGI